MEVNRSSGLFRAIAFAVAQSCTGQPHQRYLNPESPLRLVSGRTSVAVIDWRSMVSLINDGTGVEPPITVEEVQSCNTLADIYKIMDRRAVCPSQSSPTPRERLSPREEYAGALLAKELTNIPQGAIDGFGKWIAIHPEHKDVVVKTLSDMLLAINKHN